MAFLGSGLLLLNYVGAIALALRMPAAFNQLLMIPAHAVLGIMLLYKVRQQRCLVPTCAEKAWPSH